MCVCVCAVSVSVRVLYETTFCGVSPILCTSLGSVSKHCDSCCCSLGARASLQAFSNIALVSADPFAHICVSHRMGYWLSVGFSHVTCERGGIVRYPLTQ